MKKIGKIKSTYILTKWNEINFVNFVPLPLCIRLSLTVELLLILKQYKSILLIKRNT